VKQISALVTPTRTLVVLSVVVLALAVAACGADPTRVTRTVTVTQPAETQPTPTTIGSAGSADSPARSERSSTDTTPKEHAQAKVTPRSASVDQSSRSPAGSTRVCYPAVQLQPVDLPSVYLSAVDLPAQDLPAVDLPATNIPATDLNGRHYPARHIPGRHIPGRHIAGRHIPGRHIPGTHVPGRRIPASCFSAPAAFAPEHTTVLISGYGQLDPRYSATLTSQYRSASGSRSAYPDRTASGFGELNGAGFPKNQYVRPYVRKDGTPVTGYWRNSPSDGLPTCRIISC
jgi:hypothetical protein